MNNHNDTQPMAGGKNHESSGPVGIMADSHGRVGALLAGVSVLKNQGCEVLYHLGDICDSACAETTRECLAVIAEHHVLAVKGNNEHAIAVNFQDHKDDAEAILLASYLEQLPLVRTIAGAVLAHSLPFEDELGLSAMVRVMDPLAASLFFRKFPGEVLFRGHSHTPEIIYSRDGRPATRSIPVDEALCLVWDPDNDLIRSLSCPADLRA